MLIGVTGFIGSGKDTIANFIIDNYHFQRDTFAKPVKDAAAIIFGWDREMLEGTTPESREWRNLKDEYWSNILGWPVTPRKVLQLEGTEAGRNVFGANLWSGSLIKRWSDGGKKDTVVPDTRFFNEERVIKQNDGFLIRVMRGPEPSWAVNLKKFYFGPMPIEPNEWMEHYYPEVHQSEWETVLLTPDAIVSNDGSIEELFENVGELMNTLMHRPQ